MARDAAAGAHAGPPHTPLTLESRRANAAGGAVHYLLAAGAGGVPVVLVHGLASHRYMRRLAEILSATHDVYVPDLPGHGLSWKPPSHPGVAGHAAQLAAWMDRVRLRGAVLLGNSSGCNVIAELAVRRPDLAAALVLQGLVDRRQSRGALVWRWWRNGRREPSMLEVSSRDYRDAGLRWMLQGMREMLAHPLERRLPLVGCPALVVRGTRDPLDGGDWSRVAADLLPHGRLVELPGVSHTANHFAPLEVARVTEAFLAEQTNVLSR